MICPKCQAENPEGNKWCLQCKGALVTQTIPPTPPPTLYINPDLEPVRLGWQTWRINWVGVLTGGAVGVLIPTLIALIVGLLVLLMPIALAQVRFPVLGRVLDLLVFILAETFVGIGSFVATKIALKRNSSPLLTGLGSGALCSLVALAVDLLTNPSSSYLGISLIFGSYGLMAGIGILVATRASSQWSLWRQIGLLVLLLVLINLSLLAILTIYLLIKGVR